MLGQAVQQQSTMNNMVRDVSSIQYRKSPGIVKLKVPFSQDFDEKTER
jgi:hypothetical protein